MALGAAAALPCGGSPVAIPGVIRGTTPCRRPADRRDPSCRRAKIDPGGVFPANRGRPAGAGRAPGSRHRRPALGGPPLTFRPVPDTEPRTEMPDQKNLMLAIVLSIAIIF